MTSTSSLFKIPGQIHSQVPFNQLHFWKWADKEKFRSDVTLDNYLKAIGFVLNTHHLSPEEYDILRNAVDQWHRSTPWIRQRRTVTQLFSQDKESSYTVWDKYGKYTPSAEVMSALVASGWIYAPNPNNTYFKIIEDRLYAKYQTIIGSRLIAKIKEPAKPRKKREPKASMGGTNIETEDAMKLAENIKKAASKIGRAVRKAK